MKTQDKQETITRRLANTLNDFSERFSPRTRKWMLTLVGFICAACCVFSMVRPFVQEQKNRFINTKPVPMLAPIPQQEQIISEPERQELEGFIRTMDSLRKVDSKTYDNAMKGREGLIDSILFILRYSGSSLIEK